MFYTNLIFLCLFTIISIYTYKYICNSNNTATVDIFEQPAFTILNYDKYYNFFLITGFVIMFVVRSYNFGLIPGYFNQDEALAAIEAKSLLNYGVDHVGMSWPVHLTGWDSAQMSSLMTYLQIMTIKIFGLSVLGVRLPSFIISCMGIVCLFLFATKAFNKYFGLVVLYFAAINPWHIMQSRWALEANLYPHLIIIGLYFVYLAIDIKNVDIKSKILRYGCFTVSMIIFGLSMYAYGVSIYTTTILLLFLSVYLLCNRIVNIYEILFCILIYFFVAGFFIYTMVINCFGLDTIQIGCFTLPYFENSNRASDVLLFSDSVKTDFLLNIISIFFVFVLQYDTYAYNSIPNFGVVYLFTLPFIIIGFIYMSRMLKKHIGLAFVFGLFLASCVCSVLTRMVNINRVNIAHYSSILMACLGIYIICYVCKRKLVNIAAFSTYMIAFIAFVFVYFTNYSDIVDDLFYKDIAEPLKYMKELNTDDDYYLATIPEPDSYQQYMTVSEVYTMFYHDLDSEYTRNIVLDDTNQYYKDRYHYFPAGSLSEDNITSGIYMVSSDDIDKFYNLNYDIDIANFDESYVVIVR